MIRPTPALLRPRMCRGPFLLAMCCMVVVAGRCVAGDTGTPEPVRVLLVTGCDYEGHHWKETSPVLRAVLEQEDRLEVRIVDDIEFLACDTVFDYDVLLMHFKNYDVPKRFEAIQKNLTRFVGEGGGLVYFHFACGAFQEWDGFVEIAGRVWDPNGPTIRTGPSRSASWIENIRLRRDSMTSKSEMNYTLASAAIFRFTSLPRRYPRSTASPIPWRSSSTSERAAFSTRSWATTSKRSRPPAWAN